MPSLSTRGDPGRVDTRSFIALLRGVPEDSRSTLLKSKALKELVDLIPEVLDHFVLKSHEQKKEDRLDY